MHKKGNSLSRILSASAASWFRVLIILISQVALVPLYLNYWSAETYGALLLIQAIWAMITIIDVAHQDYIGYECLRITGNKKNEISIIISSAIPIVYIFAIFDLLIIILVGFSNKIMNCLINADSH